MNMKMCHVKISGIHINRCLEWNLLQYMLTKTFPGGSVVKNLPANVEDSCSIPESERLTGEENANSLQYSCLGNPMDRGAWWATVHWVTKSWTWLSDKAQTKKMLYAKWWRTAEVSSQQDPGVHSWWMASVREKERERERERETPD